MRFGNFLSLKSSTFWLVSLALIISVAFPLLERNQYLIYVGVYALFTIIFALSWDLLAFSGQASFGHAGFLGVGGYTSALFVIAYKIPIVLGLLLGGLAAALVGVVVGVLSLRLTNRVAMSLVTFGFTVVTEAIAIAINQTQAYQGFDVPLFSTTYTGDYYNVLVIAVFTTIAISIIFASPVGLELSAIREDEMAAGTIGINVQRLKLFVFIVSAFFAGLAGACFVHFIGYINVDIFTLNNNLIPIVATLLGGVNTISGPIVGAIFFSYLTEATTFLNAKVQYEVMGAILIIVVLLAPIGLVPGLVRLVKKVLNSLGKATRTSLSSEESPVILNPP